MQTARDRADAADAGAGKLVQPVGRGNRRRGLRQLCGAQVRGDQFCSGRSVARRDNAVQIPQAANGESPAGRIFQAGAGGSSPGRLRSARREHRGCDDCALPGLLDSKPGRAQLQIKAHISSSRAELF